MVDAGSSQKTIKFNVFFRVNDQFGTPLALSDIRRTRSLFRYHLAFVVLAN